VVIDKFDKAELDFLALEWTLGAIRSSREIQSKLGLIIVNILGLSSERALI